MVVTQLRGENPAYEFKIKTDLEEEWWKTPFNGMPSNPAK